MSNAANMNSLQLSISGKVLSIVNFPKSQVLQPDQNEKVENTIVVSAEKDNMQITDMYFEKSNSSAPAWQEGPPFDITFRVNRSDTADTDGFYAYRIQYAFTFAPKKTTSGYFYLKTNHPKVESIKIRGIIKPVQNAPAKQKD